VPERTIAPQPCPHALENNQRIHHAGYGAVDDAGVRPFRIAELTGLVNFVAPDAKVCGGNGNCVVVCNAVGPAATF
jgi:hypothetical protein